MIEDQIRLELYTAAMGLESLGLNSGTAGNVSVRVGDAMLITPTGVPAADLSPAKLTPVTFTGEWTGDWRPSSEWHMHASVYQAFPKAGAVVHTHADHCVALSCLRENLPAFHYMVASFGGEDVRCARYETFGSPDLAASCVEALEGRTACLLANHGMIVYAADVRKAVAQAAKLETLVRQYLLARSIGAPISIDPAKMDEVRSKYATYGQQRP